MVNGQQLLYDNKKNQVKQHFELRGPWVQQINGLHSEFAHPYQRTRWIFSCEKGTRSVMTGLVRGKRCQRGTGDRPNAVR